MSAEDQAAPAPADNGPQIVTVIGQDGYVAPDAVEIKKEPAPAVEVKEETKAAGSEESDADKTREDKGRSKPGVQDRIDELTRSRREAEREAEYWRARAQGSAAQTPAKAAAATQPPTRDDYESDEQYIDALTDYKVDQKINDREQKQTQVQAQVSKASAWQAKLESARTEIENFDSVLNSNEAPVAAHVADLIMEHDQGAKVAHHLALHPEELEKINAMSPAKAAFEIGKLATKFEAAPTPASSSKPAAAEQVSKAPPPASRNLGAGRTTETPLAELSMDEYVAKRKSQGASWAR